eukprot:Colp12_sorted_trinity150504_noHs@17804
MDARMKSLLLWGIENGGGIDPNAEAEPPKEKLDPELIKAIMGPTDAEKIKESRDILLSNESTKEQKELALDVLLFLVEGIDNANDMHTLEAFTPLFKIMIEDEHATVRMGATWVLCTCMQNNPKTQRQFLELGGVPYLVKALRTDSDIEVQSKAMSAASAFIAHNPPGIQLFERMGGFKTVLQHLEDANVGDVVLKRKATWLVKSLVDKTPEVGVAMVLERGFLPPMIKGLAIDDLDLREKILSCFESLLEADKSKALSVMEEIGVEEALLQLESQVPKTEDTEDLHRSISAIKANFK